MHLMGLAACLQSSFSLHEAPCLHAAITRAREAVVVVGSEAAIRTALQGTQGDVRLTSLHARLAAAAARLGLPAYVPLLSSLPSSCRGTSAVLSTIEKHTLGA